MHISQPPQADTKAASTDDGALGLSVVRERRRKKRLLWAVTAGVFLVAGSVGWMQTLAPVVVDVQTVSPSAIERVLAVTGRVRPQQSVQVYARSAGQIVSLTKDEGSVVESGDVLALIDPSRAKAMVAQARAARDAQRSVFAQAERDLKRANTLRSTGAVTAIALETASLNLAKSRDELRRLDAALTEAIVGLEEQTIIAPLSGRILSRPVDAGQVVNTSTTLFTIAPTSAQEVEAEVDETYSMSLREGQDTRLAFAGVSEPTTGIVTYLAPEVQTSTGGRIVRFSFLPLGAIVVDVPMGLSVDVNVIVERIPQALTVPRQVIRDAATAPFVLVVRDSTVQRQSISFIDWPATSVVVSAGLKAGDQVILSQQKLEPGTEVEVRE